MIGINNLRNTILFVLRKENRGYIGVDEFNSFVNLAQADIFENLFYEYTNWLNKENKRMTNSEYADIPKNIREQIDIFAEYATLTYDSGTNLYNYVGNDLYRAENLSLVNAQGKKIDVEEVGKSELNRIQNSDMISPSLMFPAYTRIGSSFKVLPTITSGYSLELFYIRKPKDVKWTYTLVQGNPIFNASASDKQDCELHISNFNALVSKVLLYCGISIADQEIEQIANSEEIKQVQKQS